MTHHTLPASVETCHWGYFDAAESPSLTIASGDSVTVDTISGDEGSLPGSDARPRDAYHIPPELLDVHARSARPVFGHILTGPIAIESAEPGDMLEVRIDKIDLRQDWGFNFIRPLKGTLPDDFPETYKTIIDLDRERMTGRLPWGLELPLRPFFGVMGVAPPPAWGMVSSLAPREHAGNIDNKELVAGTVLYLPVFVPGANFSCGDGHGVQGDGEVNVTAIETALQGTFTFHLHKGADFAYPRAETPSHHITMYMHPDLDRCAEEALRAMIRLLGDVAGLSAEDAYVLCSLAADLRVTQTVNGNKGIHCMIDKSLCR